MDDNPNFLFERHPQHPLLNPVVLSVLFDYCAPPELANARLVCSQWRKDSLKGWRSRAVLQLCHTAPPAAVGDDGEGNSNLDMEQFLLLLENPEEHEQKLHKFRRWPFRNYFLVDWAFGDPDTDTTTVESELRFWNLVGPLMTSLSFVDCRHSHWADQHDGHGLNLKDIIFGMTPNLQRLTISQNKFYFSGDIFPSDPVEDIVPQENLSYLNLEFSSSRSQPFPFSWADMVGHFPRLETVILRHFPILMDDQCELTDPNLTLTHFLGAVGAVRKTDRTKLAIKHLDIIDLTKTALYKIPSSQPPLFEAAKLPLETLKLDVGFETGAPLLANLLASHSSTLRTLHLFRGQFQGTPADLRNCGVLPHLRELVLYGAVFADFDFLQAMPSLEALHTNMEYPNYDLKTRPHVMRRDRALVLESTMPAESTVPLRLEGMRELKSGHLLASSFPVRWTQWFPNISRLSVSLNEESWRRVCTCWKGTLKEIHLPARTSLSDEILTGIPTGGPTPALTGAGRPPNLTDLSHLEKFSQDRDQRVYLSSHSVRHGFLHLPKLKSLSFFVEQEFDSDLMEMITQTIPDVDIKLK